MRESKPHSTPLAHLLKENKYPLYAPLFSRLWHIEFGNEDLKKIDEGALDAFLNTLASLKSISLEGSYLPNLLPEKLACLAKGLTHVQVFHLAFTKLNHFSIEKVKILAPMLAHARFINLRGIWKFIDEEVWKEIFLQAPNLCEIRMKDPHTSMSVFQ